MTKHNKLSAHVGVIVRNFYNTYTLNNSSTTDTMLFLQNKCPVVFQSSFQLAFIGCDI